MYVQCTSMVMCRGFFKIKCPNSNLLVIKSGFWTTEACNGIHCKFFVCWIHRWMSANQISKVHTHSDLNAWSPSEIHFEIWLLEKGQWCLICFSKGQFFLKKLSKATKAKKANEGQQRPEKGQQSPKTSNFFVIMYHYSK